MKFLWILAIFFVAVSANKIFKDNKAKIHGENGWYVPRVDGTFDWVSKEEAESYIEMIESFELSTNPVEYYVYTRANPSKGTQIVATTESVSASNFDASKPTYFVIHGWTQSYTSGMNKDICAAALRRFDCNVIVVDWARARSVDYATSFTAVPGAGAKVAEMIDFLNTNYNMSFDTLTVAGHSLGAHVAGYAGKNVKNGKISTIIGMDPAFPLFDYEKPDKRLAKTDGQYVQSIQTNGGKLGFREPIGEGAFYCNGGEEQPGCPLDVTGVCSHSLSTTYYAEAVDINDFGTIQCSDYEQAVADSCGTNFSTVLMGAVYDVDKVPGIFYVPVHSSYPYGVSNGTYIKEKL
ncbi:phospholipase A1 isoform X2 [Musca domestica]|uniref:Phospholipase A1 isoform X2 n=1 Tax=Musca domestica TaxID=7370 RepID=A0A9J7IDH9_MUSDO|nr:phospholipase A1 isoform X2 [Musca domestica]